MALFLLLRMLPLSKVPNVPLLVGILCFLCLCILLFSCVRMLLLCLFKRFHAVRMLRMLPLHNRGLLHCHRNVPSLFNLVLAVMFLSVLGMPDVWC